MDEQEIKSNVCYLLRQNLYKSAIKICQEGLSQFQDDPFLVLCRSLALILSNSTEEGVNDLEILKFHNDFKLSVAVTFKFLNLQPVSGDSKQITRGLDLQIRELKSTATFTDLHNTAFVFYVFKKYEKAFDLIEKALNSGSLPTESLTLKGWIALNLYKMNIKSDFNIANIFESSTHGNRKNLDGSLGLAKTFTYMGDTEEAFNALNKCIIRFPSSILPIVEKMKLQFTIQDWESCSETINRIIKLESNNLEALIHNALIFMFHHQEYDKVAVCLQELSNEILKTESKNSEFVLKICRLFSRICSRNVLILLETFSLVKSTLDLLPNNIDCIIEMGYQHLLQGDTKNASRFFKSATKLDNESIDGLLGITFCEFLENGINEQVKQQVEFLSELDGIHLSPVFIYLKAKTFKDTEKLLSVLIQLCDLHIKKIQKVPYGTEYLISIDPDFLLMIVKEILTYIPQTREFLLKPRQITKISTLTTKAEETLKIIVRSCPNLHDAAYLLAKIEIVNGRLADATNTLGKVLAKNSTSIESHLLLAQILINSGQFERAAQTLEIGLSYNFKLRENAAYYYIVGLIEKSKNRFNEAVTALTTSLNLTDFNKSENKSVTGDLQLSLSDKASICMELIDAHLRIKQIHEATRLIENASKVFEGTAEEARILILVADQALERNDIQGAVEILEKIKPSESYYLSAKTKIANIFLKTRKDYKSYLKCYQEMVEIDPGPESFVFLGDAYMNVLKIHQALDSYEKAWKCSPNDIYLITKMGWALETTHNYQKAVDFYKETIKTSNLSELKLKLITLYIKLKRYKEPETLVMEEIENEKGDDLISLKNKTQLLNMLAEIHEKVKNIRAAITDLKNARDNQKRIVKRLTVDDSAASAVESKTLTDISLKLAKLSLSKSQEDDAILYYKDALTVTPNNTEVLTALSELYMKMNKLEACQQTCSVLLSLNPESEEGSVMMADIAFRKVDFDTASLHFINLINKQPTNWKALVRLIEVQRRIDGLEEVPHYLQQAEKLISGDSKDPGFSFSSALYEWFSGNLNAALRNFNLARHDPEWGKQATANMIEICLNPEDEMFGDQLFDTDDSEYRDSRSMALKTAERLLRDLRQKSSSDEENFKCRILNNFLLIASKEKINIERALEDLISINSSDDVFREHIAVILGVATAHTLLKQGQRAKNQLKRVVKNTWTFEDAEYLERCWLLLADYYIQSSKYDLASDLLQRVLLHNKTCQKAFEFLGYIAEKEQTYKSSANYYDLAWKHGRKQNPVIGYKLAYSFMKCKKYAEAIDACQQILKNYPEYPRIKKDIMDKCLNNLRT